MHIYSIWAYADAGQSTDRHESLLNWSCGVRSGARLAPMIDPTRYMYAIATSTWLDAARATTMLAIALIAAFALGYFEHKIFNYYSPAYTSFHGNDSEPLSVSDSLVAVCGLPVASGRSGAYQRSQVMSTCPLLSVSARFVTVGELCHVFIFVDIIMIVHNPVSRCFCIFNVLVGNGLVEVNHFSVTTTQVFRPCE